MSAHWRPWSRSKDGGVHLVALRPCRLGPIPLRIRRPPLADRGEQRLRAGLIVEQHHRHAPAALTIDQPDSASTGSPLGGYGSELTASLPADVSAAARSAPEPLYSTRPRCTRWSTFSATDRCSSSESCPSAECRPSPAIAVAISDTDALPPLSCRRMSSWYGKRLMAMP